MPHGSQIIQPGFFKRPAVKVARDMLGKAIVRKHYGAELRYIVTETEAYEGQHDLA